MPRADLHCHTIHSYDASTTVEQLVRRCGRVGIDCVAVTDHNEVEGALRVRDRAPFQVIVGEEIFSREGEVIGLFLERRVAPGLSLAETIDRIKDQGGLVYLPHPVSGIRRSRLSRERVQELGPRIDIVELYNARTVLAPEAEWAWVRELTARNNLAVAAASDAHCAWEVGNAVVELEPFRTPGEFLQRLQQARLWYRRSRWWIRIAMNHRVRKALRRLKGHGR